MCGADLSDLDEEYLKKKEKDSGKRSCPNKSNEMH
jgi:hypothetical protein